MQGYQVINSRELALPIEGGAFGQIIAMSKTIPQTTQKQRLLIGQILVRAGIVEEHQIPNALQLAAKRSTRIGQALIAMGYLTADDIEPILVLQQLINDGTIGDQAAIDALYIMRRDGLPLVHAVPMAHPEATRDANKQVRRSELESGLAKLEKENKPSETLPLLQELADVCMVQRDFQTSRSCLDKALYIAEQRHGKQSIRLIPVFHQQMDLLMLEQNYKEAEAVCWRMIDISQASLGAEHIETLKILQRMGRVLDAQARASEAESFLINAVRGLEKLLGVHSPEVQTALRHFSAFWRRKSKTAKGEYKRAGELLSEAQIITKGELAEALAKSHQESIPIGQALLGMGIITADLLRSNLQAQLLVHEGVVPLTVALQALQVVAARHCPLEHALDELGWSPDPTAVQSVAEQIETTNEVISAELSDGVNHRSVAALLAKLGEQQMFARKFAQSELSLVRSLQIWRQQAAAFHADLGAALNRLANLYYVQKRHAEAQELYYEAFTTYRHALGDNHPDVAKTLRYISKVERDLGNFEKADLIWQSAAAIAARPEAAAIAAAKAIPPDPDAWKNYVASVTSKTAATDKDNFQELVNVLLDYERTRQTGQIKLQNAEGSVVAVIWFKEGVLTAIRYRHLQGRYALLELLTRKDPLRYEIAEDSKENSDADLARQSMSHWLEQANMRADAIPELLERVGWPRASWVIDEDKEFDATMDPELAPIAKEIYHLIGAKLSNTRILESVKADRYTFLLALKELVDDHFITRDLQATGSFQRLKDIEEAEKLHP